MSLPNNDEKYTTILKKNIFKSINTNKLNPLKYACLKLTLNVTQQGRIKKITYKNKLTHHFESITNSEELVKELKKSNLGIKLSMKEFLKENISVDTIIKSDICLTNQQFINTYPLANSKFNQTCSLYINEDGSKSVVKSKDCIHVVIQGLYKLIIEKNNESYIVKLGSFAETQGMSKRITSFGGGNYDTGSLTNKWFQEFIKHSISSGYSARFEYYNKDVNTTTITNLDDEEEQILPYVMRTLENALFKKYIQNNANIPPIFGANSFKC